MENLYLLIGKEIHFQVMQILFDKSCPSGKHYTQNGRCIHISKGDNFCFSNGFNTQMGSTLKEKNLLLRSKFFLSELAHIEKEAKTKMIELFPLKVYPCIFCVSGLAEAYL